MHATAGFWNGGPFDRRLAIQGDTVATEKHTVYFQYSYSYAAAQNDPVLFRASPSRPDTRRSFPPGILFRA